jgi:hypothetical protein
MTQWNNRIPGKAWSRLFIVAKGSTWGNHCKALSGVYRLIGLAAEYDLTARATVDRICGRDQTGTLYIGRSGTRPTLQGRLGRLVNSLPKESGFTHNAARRLRETSLLSRKFPPSKLAITWCYTNDPLTLERDLIAAYAESFGEAPPLNRQQRAPDD